MTRKPEFVTNADINDFSLNVTCTGRTPAPRPMDSRETCWSLFCVRTFWPLTLWGPSAYVITDQMQRCLRRKWPIWNGLSINTISRLGLIMAFHCTLSLWCHLCGILPCKERRPEIPFQIDLIALLSFSPGIRRTSIVECWSHSVYALIPLHI